MALTLASAGINAFGTYMAGLGKGKAAEAQAQADTAMAGIYSSAAKTTRYAGYRAAQDVGLQYRAQIGHQAVATAAGGTLADPKVRASQIAMGRSAEAETLNKYNLTAEQEDIKAAGMKFEAGQEQVASAEDRTGAIIGAVGAGVSGLAQAATGQASASRVDASMFDTPAAGSSASVAQKWYMLS